MKQFAFLLVLIPLLGSCVAAPFIAAGAIGVWTYDEYKENGGSIPVEAPAQDVWIAAKATAMDRAEPGQKLDINDGVMRIEGRLNDANVLISVLLYPTTDKLTEIKVTATQGLRGRADIAQEIAEDIANRL